MSRLNALALFSYGAPAFALAALTLPVQIFLPTYYAQDLGLGLVAVGLILLAVRIWDVVSDPVIGILSDKFYLPYGRRKSWLYMGAPLVLVAGWFLFVPPDNAGLFHLAIWSILLYLGWTMMILPLNALGAELSDDYHERSKISGWREGIIIAGLLSALTLTALYQDAALQILAWFIVGFLPLGLLLFWRFVPEAKTKPKNNLTISQGWQALKNNAPLRLLIVAYLINGLANALPATLFLLFCEFVLEMKDAAGQLLFIYFFAGLAGVPFWLWLAKKFSKHKIWCVAMLWACAFFLLVPLVGSGDHNLFLAISILTGLSLGADLTLPAAMQADVVDKDRLETGQRRTGLYFALWSMTTKLSLALAAGIAFPVLEFGGFTPQAPENLFILVALYSLIPVALKLIAIALMWRYPLSENELASIQQKISSKSA